MKKCGKCNQQKKLSEYNKNSHSPDGLHSFCRICQREIGRRWYHTKGKEKRKTEFYRKIDRKRSDDYRKRKMAENPNWKKLKEVAYKLKMPFVEVEQWYNKQWMKQQAQCAMCGNVFSEDDCIDHNHETNELRGLLCSGCNLGIGHLREDVRVLENGIQYLEKY